MRDDVLRTLSPVHIPFPVAGDATWSVGSGMIPPRSQTSFILRVPAFHGLSSSPLTIFTYMIWRREVLGESPSLQITLSW